MAGFWEKLTDLLEPAYQKQRRKQDEEDSTIDEEIKQYSAEIMRGLEQPVGEILNEWKDDRGDLRGD